MVRLQQFVGDYAGPDRSCELVVLSGRDMDGLVELAARVEALEVSGAVVGVGDGAGGLVPTVQVVGGSSDELVAALGVLFTEFNRDYFQFIVGAGLTTLTIGLTAGWLYKAIKSR